MGGKNDSVNQNNAKAYHNLYYARSRTSCSGHVYIISCTRTTPSATALQTAAGTLYIIYFFDRNSGRETAT